MGNIFPVRNLAKYGVLTDPDAYTIPAEAWSSALNVRFQNGKVTRGPVFRKVFAPLGSSNPRFIVGNLNNSGTSQIFLGYEGGNVTLYNPTTNSETGCDPSTYTPSSAEAVWTTTRLADVCYINRSDRTPWFLRSSDNNFNDLQYASFTASQSGTTLTVSAVGAGTLSVGQTITSTGTSQTITALGTGTGGIGTYTVSVSQSLSSQAMLANGTSAAATTMWPSNWTCNILRAFNGALCAFNVTQNGTQYPTMVCTSNFPTAGTVPSTFNTAVTTDATQNILPEFEGQIIDALPLIQNMFIYGEREVWIMQAVGGSEVYSYYPIFTNRGLINTNCVIEVAGLHWAFGPDDVWVHDGVTPRSICTDRVREFIFSGLNYNFVNRCHIYHDSLLKTLMFCYRSGDVLAKYINSTDGCNRSATYDYQRDNWTFDDLPLTYSAAGASLSQSVEYATTSSTYQNVGGTYQSSAGSSTQRSTLMVGDSNSQYNLTESLYGFDPSGPLSQLTQPVDTNATNGSYLERSGIDLDEISVDLKGYKVCQSIYPQGRLDINAAALSFVIGAADYFNSTPTYAPSMTYDGQTNYKLDFGIAGRWLDLQITFADWHFFSLSGLDFDLDTFGER